ncbi:hypothetical protein QAD02_001220 [Eretmocerus hayati]|uniref:Uncharacterized protein n=1 Tax=Eretmocerus hayati TaxID=131215 RepID=A0ACC2NGC7_9HYME|nr:hypothetical protein QAD02_001220 [Eretmocerus hayati]
MVPLTYEVKGILTVDTIIQSQDLPNLFSKSAVIMATHVFHDLKPLCLRRIMSSHMASHVNRTMNERFINKVVSVMIPKGLTIQIDSKHYIMIPEINMPSSIELPDVLNFQSKEITACIELAFHNKYFAAVSYNVSIVCQPGNKYGLELSQQPHFSWEDMVRLVVEAHQNFQSPVLEKFYSGSLADRALSKVPGYAI